jgi:hypothetical protein
MKGIRVPPQGDRDRVDDDPEHHDDRLTDDVLRRTEEAGRPLRDLTEPV